MPNDNKRFANREFKKRRRVQINFNRLYDYFYRYCRTFAGYKGDLEVLLTEQNLAGPPFKDHNLTDQLLSIVASFSM
jgi:hypothetical protein